MDQRADWPCGHVVARSLANKGESVLLVEAFATDIYLRARISKYETCITCVVCTRVHYVAYTHVIQHHVVDWAAVIDEQRRREQSVQWSSFRNGNREPYMPFVHAAQFLSHQFFAHNFKIHIFLLFFISLRANFFSSFLKVSLYYFFFFFSKFI